MMSLGAQIQQKSSFNYSDKSIAPRPGVSLQNPNIQIHTYKDGVMEGIMDKARNTISDAFLCCLMSADSYFCFMYQP